MRMVGCKERKKGEKTHSKSGPVEGCDSHFSFLLRPLVLGSRWELLHHVYATQKLWGDPRKLNPDFPSV